MDNDLLTVEETATLLKVHKDTIYGWLAEGKLPGTKIGDLWRITRNSIDKLFEVQALGAEVKKREEAIPGYLYMLHEATKNKARSAVYLALQAGVLVRKPCEECGELEVEAHHDDYDEPLKVRWLCVPHHAKLHRGELTEKEANHG